MKKIDFTQVEIYTGIAKKACIVQDIREAFADALYSQSVGLKSHALALKIFNSTGAEEYSDEEITIIRNFAEQCCSPSLIDAINKITE